MEGNKLALWYMGVASITPYMAVDRGCGNMSH